MPDDVCAACGKPIIDGDGVKHHTSYISNTIVRVHFKCHTEIHHTDKYLHLKPPYNENILRKRIPIGGNTSCEDYEFIKRNNFSIVGILKAAIKQLRNHIEKDTETVNDKTIYRHKPKAETKIPKIGNTRLIKKDRIRRLIMSKATRKEMGFENIDAFVLSERDNAIDIIFEV